MSLWQSSLTLLYGRIPTTQYGVSHAIDKQWKVNNTRLMYHVNKIHKNAIGYLKNKEIISFTGEHFKENRIVSVWDVLNIQGP